MNINRIIMGAGMLALMATAAMVLTAFLRVNRTLSYQE